jgi:hypothetical protein
MVTKLVRCNLICGLVAQQSPPFTAVRHCGEVLVAIDFDHSCEKWLGSLDSFKQLLLQVMIGLINASDKFGTLCKKPDAINDMLVIYPQSEFGCCLVRKIHGLDGCIHFCSSD